MKILITGGMGFIGSHLREFFRKFHPDYQLILLDLQNGEDLLKIENFPKVDYVIHLAAQTDVQKSINDPYKDAEINILGSLKLIINYKETKIIYVGSAASFSGIISSPYGLSKKIGVEYIKLLSKNWVICNLPNVFGEGGKRVVEKFIQAKEIRINGDGKQTRDFVYVGDICRGLIQAFGWASGEYFLGSNKAMEINQIAKVLNKPIIYLPELKGEIKYSQVINNTPDWQPEIRILEYLTKTVQ